MAKGEDIDDLLKEAREWEELLLASKLDKDVGRLVARLRRCIEQLAERREAE